VITRRRYPSANVARQAMMTYCGGASRRPTVLSARCACRLGPTWRPRNALCTVDHPGPKVTGTHPQSPVRRTGGHPRSPSRRTQGSDLDRIRDRRWDSEVRSVRCSTSSFRTRSYHRVPSSCLHRRRKGSAVGGHHGECAARAYNGGLGAEFLVRGSGLRPPEAESILVIGCPTEPANLAQFQKMSLPKTVCFVTVHWCQELGAQSAWCPQPRRWGACAPPRSPLLRRLWLSQTRLVKASTS